MGLLNCPTRLGFSLCQGQELASGEGLDISGPTRRLQGMVCVFWRVFGHSGPIAIGLG